MLCKRVVDNSGELSDNRSMTQAAILV